MSKEQLEMITKEPQEFATRTDDQAPQRIWKIIELKDYAPPQRIRKVIELDFQKQASSTIKKMIEIVLDHVPSKGEKKRR